VEGCTLGLNHPPGGDGTAGGGGGNGFGGGGDNDAGAVNGTSAVPLGQSPLSKNHANGGDGGEGGSDGEGIGGGVYNLGLFTLDGFTAILANHASTSHDGGVDVLGS